MSTDSKSMVSFTSRGWVKWLVMTLVLGVLAFLASPGAPLGGFWGTQAERTAPGGIQTLFFILLSAIQSLAFGLGIAFLIFGFSLVGNVPAGRSQVQAAHLAIAWSLISWWLHSSFHQSLQADNINGLLAVEYGFHATLILAGLIVASFFLTILRQGKMQAGDTGM